MHCDEYKCMYTLQFSDSLLHFSVCRSLSVSIHHITCSSRSEKGNTNYHSTLQILHAHVSVCIWCNRGVSPNWSPVYPPQTQAGNDECINVYLICSVMFISACTHYSLVTHDCSLEFFSVSVLVSVYTLYHLQ